MAMFHNEELGEFVPQNHNSINSLVLNNGKLIGKAYSKFDPITTEKAFGWELAAKDIQDAREHGTAFSGIVKEVEYHSDALYTAKFFFNLEHCGDANITAKIFWVKDFQPPFSIDHLSYYFVINNTAKLYGSTIPSSDMRYIVDHQGTLEIIADFTNFNPHVNYVAEDENYELPFENDYDNIELPFDIEG
uniref:Uncharacterized protein n=1 Tax=Panagrolaimus sp. PS1159 TaxID=55785 RepID=A0AC35GK44_9BILA